jgi:hypothetical protein
LGRLAWGCGLDSTGSGQGPVVGCFKCGDEPSGSCATELVIRRFILKATISSTVFTLVISVSISLPKPD